MRNSLLRWLLWFLCSAGAALISPYSTKPHTSISLYTGQDQTSECRDESQMAQENESRTRIVLVRIYPWPCKCTTVQPTHLSPAGATRKIFPAQTAILLLNGDKLSYTRVCIWLGVESEGQGGVERQKWKRGTLYRRTRWSRGRLLQHNTRTALLRGSDPVTTQLRGWIQRWRAARSHACIRPPM